nr:MAG TPA: hypothetical protein [Caudoviricetes sp.]
MIGRSDSKYLSSTIGLPSPESSHLRFINTEYPDIVNLLKKS